MALHVLHRLIVPRHPPCALKSNKSNTKTHTKHMNTTTGAHASGEQQNHKKLDTRVHYTVLKQHEHHPHTTNHNRSITRRKHPNRNNNTCHSRHPTTQQTKHTQDLNTTTHTNNQPVIGDTQANPHDRVSNAHDSPTKNNKQKLLRKEVIQPHLPVRLPCYDFVPIADPTFDGSLTSLGHRLRVLPTFMT